MHPIHLACIHFYLALSHDALARETPLKRRYLELNLAEQHYVDAMTSLTPPNPRLPPILEQQPPTSPDSEDEHAVKGRRTSDASQQSLASSATSLADEDYESTRNILTLSKTNSRSRNESKSPSRNRRPSPIFTPNARYSYLEEQTSIDLSTFKDMIRSHLHEVRTQKLSAVVPSVRFSTSRDSIISSRPTSRDLSSRSSQYESEMESVRDARKRLTFRPRFDPTSVRKLCDETLHELRTGQARSWGF
jgi:hypothetical protein